MVGDPELPSRRGQEFPLTPSPLQLRVSSVDSALRIDKQTLVFLTTSLSKTRAKR